MTGYHMYLITFILLASHLPFGIGVASFSWAAELRVLAFFVLFFLIEDFLWFIFNPAFGIRRFRKEYIWWHAMNWWGFMPCDYWLFIPLGLILYGLSYSF